MTLVPGLTGEATTTVTHENTAASVGAGGVEVFGTPMDDCIDGECCLACCCRKPCREGDVTVGTVVNVRHLAATPLGQQIRATAELIEIDGRRLVFNVEAYDQEPKNRRRTA